MKYSLVLCLVLFPILLATSVHAAEAEADDTEPGELEPIVLGVDLLPLVGTSSVAPERPRYLSLNLIGGISGGVRVFEVGGLANIATGPVTGVQLSGAANVNFASTDALQVAGLVNANGGDGTGVRVAGAVNASLGNSNGVQVAGATNVNRGNFEGVQVSGAANLSAGDFQGIQVAGAANLITGTSRGIQVAPINVSAGHHQGLQVGVINIARSADASIGIVNIHLDGYIEPELYGSDDGLLMLGIRHGTGAFYSVYSLGTRFIATGDRGPALAGAFGLGWRIELVEGTELSLDLTSTSVVAETRQWDWSSTFTLLKFRPMVSFNVLESLAIFGGPTLTLMQPQRARNVDPDDYSLIDPWPIGDNAFLWPGFTLGVRLM